MAMLATKAPPFPTTLMSSTSGGLASTGNVVGMKQSTRRTPAMLSVNQAFSSPTESEFSEADGSDATRNWDEEQVGTWLRSIKCQQYEKLFKKNHIKGDNLLEIDKAVLQEMGIEKVGDRVRLFLAIKKLRTKAYANQKKRNGDSVAGLDSALAAYTPTSSGSPRPAYPAGRSMPTPPANKRYSRQIDSFSMMQDPKPSSRPSSPMPSSRQRYAAMASPATETSKKDSSMAYFSPTGSQPSSAATLTGRRPATPQEAISQVRVHQRANGSIDGSLMAQLPQNQDMIRVISVKGVTKVVKVADCRSCDEVMRVTLRKFGYREDHDRNYCFYVLAGIDPDPSQCRKLSENELWRIIKDTKRPERNRLILRKIHAGEPGEDELKRAAEIATEEAASNHGGRVTADADKRHQLKTTTMQKAASDNWNDVQYPLSPASFTSSVSISERERNVYNAAKDLERPAEPPKENPRARAGKKGVLRQFLGQRPPSELITSDLTTYFPDHPREEIDRTARMSMRRSARLSKANSRLSVMSTLSFASSTADAPPMPTIADSWLSGNNQVAKLRNADISRGNSQRFRDSIASSVLERVQEESPIEPNRKSYVSFGSGSSIADVSRNDVVDSYYDSNTDTQGGSTLGNDRTLQGGEDDDVDEELESFLQGDSWDDSKWMKGALIGQGSFGSVYLALHAVTGELLAVKQVETPSPNSNRESDAKKKSMIDALKREISFLRELQHPNIVQYLGASSSADHLNIFLEYVPGGSVQTMLNSYGALREPLIRTFVRQIVTGLAYLHGRDIIHRDIKGANILVDNKGGIKISDFGISKKIEASNLLHGAGNNKNRPSLQGSVFWMAPEVVKQTSYTRKADIWSLGCLVIEMMTGNHPFPDCSQLQAIFKIGGAKISPTIPDDASPDAKVFLSQTFEVEHTKRPSAEELLLSPFLN